MKLFEHIFREANKARLLKPLYDLYNTDDTISFDNLNEFATRFDNKFDWNSPDKEELFNKILSAYKAYIENGGSRKERKETIKKDVNKIFKEEFGDRCVKEYDPDSENGDNIDVIILDELENENWIFVVPLQHEAAVFMNSYKCGGAGAKWCIGTAANEMYWYEYICDDQDIFVMALNKNAYKGADENDIKYMLEIEPEPMRDDVCWNQNDSRDVELPNWKEKFGVTWNDINEALVNHNIIQFFIDRYNQDNPSY